MRLRSGGLAPPRGNFRSCMYGRGLRALHRPQHPYRVGVSEVRILGADRRESAQGFIQKEPYTSLVASLDRETGQGDFFHDSSTTKRTYHPKLEALGMSKPAKNMLQLQRTPENRHAQHRKILMPTDAKSRGMRHMRVKQATLRHTHPAQALQRQALHPSP